LWQRNQCGRGKDAPVISNRWRFCQNSSGQATIKKNRKALQLHKKRNSGDRYMSNKKAIMIGAGISGLSAGCYLQKNK